MTLTNNHITSPNGFRGNALSDQTPQVRDAMLAQLHDKGTPFLPSVPPETSPLRGTSPATDTRGFDPALFGALTAFVEAIAGFVLNRTGSGARDLDRGEMRKDYVFGPGQIEYFPTWSFWGRTFVRMINTGSVPTVVTINDDRFHLNPGEQTDKDGLWAAFPIRVVNTIELPGSQVTIRVW